MHKLTCTLIGANNSKFIALALQTLEITLREGTGQIEPESATDSGGIVITLYGAMFLELLRRYSRAQGYIYHHQQALAENHIPLC